MFVSKLRNGGALKECGLVKSVDEIWYFGFYVELTSCFLQALTGFDHKFTMF